MSTPKQKLIFSLFILSTLGAALLSACAGQTLIDVNIDPTTGSGQIVVNPPAQQATQIPDTGAQPPSDMSQVALFAIIVILLLGVMAIVFSVARRPRSSDE
jgi:hypothetical protein